MNRKYYSALAVSAAAVGMVVLTSTDASAQLKDPEPGSAAQPTQNVAPAWPDEGSGYPTSTTPKGNRGTTPKPEYNYPNYDPKYGVTQATTTTAPAASSHDDTTTEVLQSGASALGGAAVALSCVWLYRRHQLRTA
ncbi:MAG TPA: hypothetical protein VFI00_19105 [Kribbella sp.]|nr:hypothetical protein [Kribbella sp.]